MATSANSNGTFATVQPLQGNVSDLMQYQDQVGFQHRAEQRAIDAEKRRQKEAEDKKKADLRDQVVKSLRRYDTGSQSLNEVVGRALQDGTNEYLPIVETLSNPNASDQEKLKAQLKAQNLDNLPENLKLVTDFYTRENQDYQTGVKANKYFEDPNYEKKFQGGFSQYHIAIDDMGLPIIAFRDLNGDGIIDVEPFENIKSGVAATKFQSKYDLDAIAKETADRLGTTDITKQNGYTTTQEKMPKAEALESMSNKLFYDQNGAPTSVALSEARKQNVEPTKENLEAIRQQFKANVLGQKDYLKKKTFDFNAQDADQDRALKGKLAEKIPAATIAQPVLPEKRTWGDHMPNIDPNKVYAVPVIGKVVLPAIPLKNGKTITNANLANYTYDKNGKLILNVSYETSKSSSYTQEQLDSMSDEQKINLGVQNHKENVLVSNENESKIASVLGMTVDQMRQSAKRYSSVEERAIQAAMQDNPGYSRQQIVEALQLK